MNVRAENLDSAAVPGQLGETLVETHNGTV
jgi:hypothetical protein